MYIPSKRVHSNSSISPRQEDKMVKTFIFHNRFAVLTPETIATFWFRRQSTVLNTDEPDSIEYKSPVVPAIYIKDISNLSDFNDTPTKNHNSPNTFKCKLRLHIRVIIEPTGVFDYSSIL